MCSEKRADYYKALVEQQEVMEKRMASKGLRMPTPIEVVGAYSMAFAETGFPITMARKFTSLAGQMIERVVQEADEEAEKRSEFSTAKPEESTWEDVQEPSPPASWRDDANNFDVAGAYEGPTQGPALNG